ncbi:MAG: flagellar basal body-associated FliL family protein [Lachnospiraceae bacterium]|nr:flagellar basal body-associated FliL family protein [Lachnospiraceae bacterium]
MKRNMLAIVILAVCIINMGINAFMMLTVMNTNSKTVKLISDVAAAVNIDNTTIANSTQGYGSPANVPFEKTVMYDINGDNKMTIALAPGEDGETHYVQLEVALSLNSDSEGYKIYDVANGGLDSRLSRIKSVVQEVVSSYTFDGLRANEAEAKDQILQKLQEMFESDFIFKVDFPLIQYA